MLGMNGGTKSRPVKHEIDNVNRQISSTFAEDDDNKEPLLGDLKEFIKKHPYLERDYSPLQHPARKNKNKIST